MPYPVAASRGGIRTMVSDTVPPSCTITSLTTVYSGEFYNGTLTLQYTFSEDVYGFTSGDIVVSNGSSGSFSAVSASVYTSVITPTAEGLVTVSVPAEVCEDGAGNLNTASSPYQIDYVPMLIIDKFTDTRAAGSVNGTSAEPGGSLAPTRTVIDANSKISIGSGVLSFATGAVGYDGVRWGTIDREFGRVIVAYVSPISGNDVLGIGLDTNTTGIATNVLRLAAGGTLIQLTDNGGTAYTVGSFSNGTSYYLLGVLRATGIYWLVKGGAYTSWTLLGIGRGGSDASMYPTIQCLSTTSVFTVDEFRVPTTKYTTLPYIAFDTLTQADGSLNGVLSDATAADGQAVTQRVWTSPNGAISGNKLVITPTLGAEMWDADAAVFTSGTYAWTTFGTNTLDNDSNTLKVTRVDNANGARVYFKDADDLSSDLTVGTWYEFQFDSKVSAGNDVAILASGLPGNAQISETSTDFVTHYLTFRSSSATANACLVTNMGVGEICWLDNLSIKPITLSTCFTSLTDSSTVGVVTSCDITWTQGTDAGIVSNLDSVSSPANFLLCYLANSGGTPYVFLDKCVGGTYTNLTSGTITYGAGYKLELHTFVSGGNLLCRVYYNGALVGTEQTVSDAEIVSNTIHGLFSTYSGNSFTNFSVMEKTNSRDYEFELNKYIGSTYAKIASSDTDPTIVSPITFTYTWTKDVTGFTIDDAVIANGTKVAFTTIDAKNYTLTVIPDAGATVTASVAAGVCTSIATGESNEASISYSVNSKVVVWDDFSVDRAAGSVNGTSADGGPGTRVVVDTGSQLSIGSGVLNITGGASNWTTPGIWWDGVTRGYGLLLVCEVTPAATNKYSKLGFDTNQSGGELSEAHHYMNATAKINSSVGSGTTTTGAFAASSTYLAVVMRATGAYFFIKGGGLYTNWTYLGTRESLTTATIYPSVGIYDMALTSSFVRVFKSGSANVPHIAFDSMTQIDGSLNGVLSDAIAPDGQSVTRRTWTAPNGAISSNKLVITPTLGAELWDADAAVFTSGTYAWAAQGTNNVTNDSNTLKIEYVDNATGAYEALSDAADLNSDLTVGTWYQLQADTKVSAGGSVTLYTVSGNAAAWVETATDMTTHALTLRASSTTANRLQTLGLGAGESIWIDNLSLKPLTLSTCFASLTDTATAGVVATANVTYTAGFNAGLVLNLDSASSPANFLVVYVWKYQGTTNVINIDKCIGGTWTNVVDGSAISYSGGARLEAHTWVSGTNLMLRVYYNGALVGSEQTIADVAGALRSNTIHGLFSTSANNSFTNFSLQPKTGTVYDNEFDKFIS